MTTQEERVTAQGETRQWLARYRAMHESRDDMIRQARQLGIGPTEIAVLSGLTTSTISKIIRGPDGGRL